MDKKLNEKLDIHDDILYINFKYCVIREKPLKNA